MAEPYKRVGRGGAGNFYSPQDVEDVNKAAESSDIEAQTSPANTASLAASLNASQPPPEYLHTGRGGAGNWVQPSELSSQGLAQVASPTGVSTEAPRKGSVLSKPTYRGGRGGAGNYVDLEAEEKVRKEEEERVRRETEQRIERDVEAGLARPERAYGGIGGAFEMGRMN